MRLKTNLALLSLVTLLFVSCQKELSIDTINGPVGGPGGGGGSNSLIGNWKFLELLANTESSVEATDGTDTEKAVTVSSYKSINNKGTIAFDATKVVSTGVGYDISDTAFVHLYLNGVLLDSTDFPFNYTAPPSSGQSNYKVIGTDSIYFENGFLSLPNADPQATQGAGGKFKIEGNILTLTINSSITESETDQGVTTITKAKVAGVIRMQRQ
jgi:hypothetical protein